jgi:hypothetical protein
MSSEPTPIRRAIQVSLAVMLQPSRVRETPDVSFGSMLQGGSSGPGQQATDPVVVVLEQIVGGLDDVDQYLRQVGNHDPTLHSDIATVKALLRRIVERSIGSARRRFPGRLR